MCGHVLMCVHVCEVCVFNIIAFNLLKWKINSVVIVRSI